MVYLSIDCSAVPRVRRGCVKNTTLQRVFTTSVKFHDVFTRDENAHLIDNFRPYCILLLPFSRFHPPRGGRHENGQLLTFYHTCPTVSEIPHMDQIVYFEEPYDLAVAAYLIPCPLSTLRSYLLKHKHDFPSRYRYARYPKAGLPIYHWPRKRIRFLRASEVAAVAKDLNGGPGAAWQTYRGDKLPTYDAGRRISVQPRVGAGRTTDEGRCDGQVDTPGQKGHQAT